MTAPRLLDGLNVVELGDGTEGVVGVPLVVQAGTVVVRAPGLEVGDGVLVVEGAGTWRYEKGSVRLEPFAPLPRQARRELEEEAERLAGFHAGEGERPDRLL